MTLFSLLISFVNRELACDVDSVRQSWLSFKHDFSFYSDSVFAEDFLINTGIACMTIPCVKQESIFAIGFTRRSWILWRCRLHTSAATHILVVISGSTVVLGDDFWSVVTQFSLAIPCINGDSLFSFDFVRQPWISMRCRFHPSAWLSFKDDFSLYSD